MALGTNRDYKTTDRRVRKNLALHDEAMQDLMRRGFDKVDASRIALAFVLHQECPVCQGTALGCKCFARKVIA